MLLKIVIYSDVSHEKLLFSIAMFNYQRVSEVNYLKVKINPKKIPNSKEAAAAQFL